MASPDDLQVGHVCIPRGELEFSFARSSAPGGQNVNKVNSKAVLHWDVNATACLPPDVKTRFMSRYANRITVDGQVVLSSEVHRDQPRNVEDCLQKLCAMVEAVLHAPKKRRPTRPSRGAVKRRLANKSAHSDKKRQRSHARDDD